MGQRRCACIVSTSDAASAHVTRGRRLPSQRRKGREPTRSQRRSEFLLSPPARAMSPQISRQSRLFGAPVTSARPSSPLIQLPSATNVDTYYVPNVHANQPSCRSGPLGLPEMWKTPAIPKQRNRWSDLDVHGGSHGREFGGSAKSVMALLSMDHHPVQGVDIYVVKNALDHRKSPLTMCIPSRHL
jgi:hypothetical protein